MIIITFLDAHSGFITSVATIVLVAITGFYAWATWRLLQEQKRDRQRKSLPRLRVFEMRRILKVVGSAGGEAQTEGFYEVQLTNIGEGIAYVEGVRIWDGRAPADRDHEIDMVPYSYKKVLFPGEKDTLSRRMDIPKEADVGPTKVQIWYRDEFNNLITYIARISRQVTEAPLLRVPSYITHEYKGPEQKVAKYVPAWENADKLKPPAHAPSGLK